MPRGDGTGPAGGGGGRRRGGGGGRGQGRRLGRSVRRGIQAGAVNQTARPPGLLVSPSGRNATPVANVDEEACILCGACQAACPTEAIMLGEVAVRVNTELCCGCGACVGACPNGAIRLN